MGDYSTRAQTAPVARANAATPAYAKRQGHTVEYMQRAAEMVKMRSAGQDLRAIADHYQVSYETVRQSIKAAVDAVPYEAVIEMRSMQLDALNLQKRRVLRAFLVDHPKVDHGHVVKRTITDAEGNTTTVEVIDWDITLRASAELRKIEDSISRLTGTRAPIVHEVHEISEDALDAEIRELTEALRIRAASIDFPIDVDSWDGPAELEAGQDDAAATASAAGGTASPG